MQRSLVILRAFEDLRAKLARKVREIEQHIKLLCFEMPSLSVSMSNMEGLPAELLFSIADSLQIHDLYSLSLCCRRFCKIFQSWTKSLDIDLDNRLSFLRRLERDQPQYLVCYYCWTLHPYKRSIVRFGPTGLSLKYICDPSFVPVSKECSLFDPMYLILHHHHTTAFHYDFHFLHLNFAMKYFYYGPQYGISIDMLSFTEVIHRPRWTAKYVNTTILLSVEAQICPKPPGFYMRVQDIMRVPDIRAFLPAEDIHAYPDPHVLYRICGHIPVSLCIEYIASSSSGLKQCAHSDSRPIHFSNACGKCNTDYMLEIYRDCEGHFALIITRWIHLGAGITPNDPRWRVHARFGLLQPEVLDLEYITSSPRTTFEELADISSNALRYRNLSYLKYQRYQSVMVPIPGHVCSWGLGHRFSVCS